MNINQLSGSGGWIRTDDTGIYAQDSITSHNPASTNQQVTLLLFALLCSIVPAIVEWQLKTHLITTPIKPHYSRFIPLINLRANRSGV